MKSRYLLSAPLKNAAHPHLRHASWEEARYLRHRAVAFDRKFKDTLELQVQHLASQQARREALAKALAEHLTQRPPEAQHLMHLEEKVAEAQQADSN